MHIEARILKYIHGILDLYKFKNWQLFAAFKKAATLCGLFAGAATKLPPPPPEVFQRSWTIFVSIRPTQKKRFSNVYECVILLKKDLHYL